MVDLLLSSRWLQQNVPQQHRDSFVERPLGANDRKNFSRPDLNPHARGSLRVPADFIFHVLGCLATVNPRGISSIHP